MTALWKGWYLWLLLLLLWWLLLLLLLFLLLFPVIAIPPNPTAQALANEEQIIKLVSLAAENNEGNKVYMKFKNERNMFIKGYDNGENGEVVLGCDCDCDCDDGDVGFCDDKGIVGDFYDVHDDDVLH